LIYRWCKFCGLQESDTFDISQEVFRSVARSIVRYQHGRKGDSFRGWLKTITLNKVRDFVTRQPDGIEGEGGSNAWAKMLAIADKGPHDSDSQPSEDEELVLLRRAIELILAEFQDESRQAFMRVMVDEQKPADVAKELGISVNAVYLANSRIRRRLRSEFSELIELN
jgi:RNA polymerase sigma-70 factor (ECF subfamily)